MKVQSVGGGVQKACCAREFTCQGWQPCAPSGRTVIESARTEGGGKPPLFPLTSSCFFISIF